MNESKLRSSVTLRMFVMAMVVVFLLILAAVIGSLISERQHRRDEAINEVSQKWGNIQTITGPVLSLPFRKPTKDEKGKTVFYSDCLDVMPETLQAEVKLNPEIRYRGIYEAVLYQAVVKLKGTFILPKMEKYDLSPEHLILKEAFVTVGITDLRGIKNVITLDWGGETLSVSPGVKLSNIVKSGFTVFPKVNLSRAEYAFSVDLLLNGSREFNIIPVERRPSLRCHPHGVVQASSGIFSRRRGRSARKALGLCGASSTSIEIFRKPGQGELIPLSILNSESSYFSLPMDIRG